MRVLIGFECSGIVRDAFARRGHFAVSCDLLPSEAEGNHHQGDIFEFIEMTRGCWDAFICHPDCTYLCSSGLHWNKRPQGIAIDRQARTDAAIAGVERLFKLEDQFKYFCLENPVGCIGTRIRKATQWIQPNQFGEDASKNTGLWLHGLPPLVPTKHIAPRVVPSGPYKGKLRWANQTDGGQNREGPKPDRWLTRARTYSGIGDAMARQWGIL